MAASFHSYFLINVNKLRIQGQDKKAENKTRRDDNGKKT
jgi:hypothetical protein